jgi:biopolymer transport protein ExbD
MRLDLDDGDDEVGINMAPMIDIVFLLLIFFLTATTFAREEVEMDLKLPEAQSGVEGKNAHPLIVQVFADGRMTLDGREVTLEALRQKLLAAAARNQQQSVLVRGDKQAQFGLGLQVLDACRLARLAKVDFAALPARQD